MADDDGVWHLAKRVGGGVLLLLGIAGSYITVREEGWEWLALVFGGGLLLGLIPFLKTPYDRITKYPRLLKEAAALKEQRDRLLTTQRSQQHAVEDMFERGVEEGKRQIIGFAFAMPFADTLKLIAITEEGGALLMIAKSSETAAIPIGARFEIRSKVTKKVKGVVEAVAWDEDRHHVSLRCVDRTVEPFWLKLEQQAPADEAPPEGIEFAAAQWKPPAFPDTQTTVGNQGG